MVVGIVGSRGLVGSTLLELLNERGFPISELRRISVQDKSISFEGVDLVFLACSDDRARELAPQAVKQGALAIDLSGAWRLDSSVPLVVPEINSADLAKHRGIISSPNCTVPALAICLKAIAKLSTPTDVVVTTLQSASGSGNAGLQQLHSGEHGEAFPHPLNNNILPQCESFLGNGFTTEEEKLLFETRKLLNMPELNITMTCVRVPVEVGHSATVLVNTADKLNVNQVEAALAEFSGIDLFCNNTYPTPLSNNPSKVNIGRVRIEHFGKRIWLWQVSNNLYKGGALNAIQIAEELLKQGFV